MSTKSEPTPARPSPISRRAPTWLVVGIAVAALLVGLGGGYLWFKPGSSGGSATSGTVSGLPVPATIPTVQGWYRNTSFTYLDFGPNTNVTAPILVFLESGVPVNGQHNIIDTIPGQPGYTAFWRVYQVAVPSGYIANSVRSLAEVAAKGYSVTETTTVVNCPVVNPTTVVQGPSPGITQGWYRNESVDYWSGETNSLAFGDVVATAPLYAFSYSNGTAVTDQRHIVDVLPGQHGYSDLWQVYNVVVPSGYVANTYQSSYALLQAEAQGKVTITPTAMLVNCPVVG